MLLGGRDRVIVPASPPLGREGVYIPSTLPISSPHHHPHPPTFTRQDLFGQLAQLVSLAFVLASSSSPPPFYTINKSSIAITSSSHREPSAREARNTIHHRSRAVDIRFATGIPSGLSITASSSHTFLSDRDLLDPSFASSLILYITQTYTASTLLCFPSEGLTIINHLYSDTNTTTNHTNNTLSTCRSSSRYALLT